MCTRRLQTILLATASVFLMILISLLTFLFFRDFRGGFYPWTDNPEGSGKVLSNIHVILMTLSFASLLPASILKSLLMSPDRELKCWYWLVNCLYQAFTIVLVAGGTVIIAYLPEGHRQRHKLDYSLHLILSLLLLAAFFIRLIDPYLVCRLFHGKFKFLRSAGVSLFSLLTVTSLLTGFNCVRRLPEIDAPFDVPDKADPELETKKSTFFGNSYDIVTIMILVGLLYSLLEVVRFLVHKERRPDIPAEYLRGDGVNYFRSLKSGDR